MLPFTEAQFFEVFARYNAALWPASLLGYALGAVVLGGILAGLPHAARAAAMVLALMWAWTGLAYHFVFFASINPAANLFAALFVIGALAFLWHGVIHRRLVPVAWLGWRSGLGWALIAYAAAGYPLIGLAAGHAYGGLPQFGVTPCPVTLFTLGLVLLMRKPVPWTVLAVPVAWSLIGGSAAFLLGIPQDWPLLAAGLATIAALRRSGA